MLLAVALVAGVLALSLRDPGRKATFVEPDRSAEHLTSAATHLLENQGARYGGWFTGPDGERVTVSAMVTNEGALLADLTTDGETVTLTAIGDKTFVRAGRAFWRANDAPPDSIDRYAKRWVKVPSDFFGTDIPALLAPGALARTLGAVAEGSRVSSGQTTTLHGVVVQAVQTPDITVYVTVAEPRRIVRIAAGSGTDGEPGGVQPSPSTHRTTRRSSAEPRVVPEWAPGATDFEIDLSGLAEAEVEDLYARLDKQLHELKTSIDSQVRFALTGSITLSPCTTTGCRANVTISNTVASRSPYLRPGQRVHAEITIRMTLDGRPVANCVKPTTMRPNRSASVSRFAAYHIPPSRNPRTHTVRAVASAVARAVIAADIRRMARDLAAEQKRNRPRPDTTPIPDGSATPSPDPSAPGRPPLGDDGNECDIDPFLDPTAERHVIDRHFEGGRLHTPNDSTWDKDNVDLYELAEDAADFPAKPQGNDRCVRVGDAGRPIGTDERGHLTSTYTVVHLKNGRVWTMHPGRPRG
jgi:hypothetical protein